MSLHPKLPVQITVLTLLGVISYRNLAGISSALWGIWKSPSTSTRSPVYSSSVIFDDKIIIKVNFNVHAYDLLQ